MAALDLPPVVGLVGDLRYAFAARPGPRRLAQVALVVSVVLCGCTWALAVRHPERHDPGTFAVLPMVCVALAAVGTAVRRARVWLDAGGVRWGWPWLAIRVEPTRLRAITVYADGITLAIGRGAPWFLGARDWANFDGLCRAAQRSGFAVTTHTSAAPWRARVQSYGHVLDGMMVFAMVGAAGLTLAAAG